MSLDGKTILVTGGSGQIGIAILQDLQSHHSTATLHSLDLSIPATTDARHISAVHYHAGSITDREVVNSLLGDVTPEVVFHTAGLIPQIAARLGKNTLRDYLEVNFEGTKIVLQESKANGVRAFVLTSSADVVKGNSWDDLDGVDESFPVPKTFDGWYAESKVSSSCISSRDKKSLTMIVG